MINNAFWNGHGRVYKKLYIIKDRPETLIFNHFIKTWTRFLESEWEQSKIVELMEMRKNRLNQTFVLDPVFIKEAFASFETIANRTTKHPISTGFIGMYTSLRSCASVSAFGFCDTNLDIQFRTQWHELKHEHIVYKYWYENSNNLTNSFKLALYPPPKTSQQVNSTNVRRDTHTKPH